MGTHTGACLRHYRLLAGYSGKEAASLLGVTPPYVTMVETGGKNLSAASAAQWARTLGQDPAEAVQAALQDELDRVGLRMRVLIVRPGERR